MPKKCVHGRQKNYCKICSPRGWAVHVIASARYRARKRNYAAPDITPEKLVGLSAESCFFCRGIMNEDADLHHDHLTGEVYGFAHRGCNIAHGWLMRLSTKDRRSFLASF
jgi:hypothetical protein